MKLSSLFVALLLCSIQLVSLVTPSTSASTNGSSVNMSSSPEHTRSYVEAIIALILLTVVILSVITILVCTYTEGKYCFGEQGEPQVHPKAMGPDSSTLVLKKPGMNAQNAAAPAGAVKTGAGKSASMLVKSAVKSSSSKTMKSAAKAKAGSGSSKSRNIKSFSSGREK